MTCSLETSFEKPSLRGTLLFLAMVNNSDKGAYPVGGSLNIASNESAYMDNEHTIILSLVKKSFPSNLILKSFKPTPPMDAPGRKSDVIDVFSAAAGK